jgi:uncharacterized protein (TIGR02145 family)
MNKIKLAMKNSKSKLFGMFFILISVFIWFSSCSKDQEEYIPPAKSPNLVLNINPPYGAITQRYYIDVLQSTDPNYDYKSLQVKYDLNNDGNFDTDLLPADSILNLKVFATGTYKINVKLINPSGLYSIKSYELTVEECPEEIIDPRDGEKYRMVSSGNQCWMSENLRYGALMSSDMEPESNGIVEKYAYMNDNANLKKFGALYTWNELFDVPFSSINSGLCPEGFHVPTDQEFAELEIGLGMSAGDSSLVGWRGNEIGNKLKAPNGFNVLLSGQLSNGTFHYMNEYEYLWTETLINGKPMRRTIGKNRHEVGRFFDSQYTGASVRCIRD